MAKWEIIEDNKFKKQTGGKSPATRIVTIKNSKNNPIILPEVTVVAPKTINKNKPIVQKQNIPLEQNNPLTKVIIPDLKQREFKKNYPGSKINLNNTSNLTDSDSLYYGVPYKNGKILNQEIWNKNKAIENKKGAALYKNVKKGIDIGQTIAGGLEVFPPTSAIGFAINAGLTVPSVAINYHDKNYSGMIPDAVGLVPGNILPPGVDLGKSVGEIGYNGYNIYQDFKQTGGKAAASKLQQQKNGGIIEDPRGQWAHPGSVTRIPSNQITMQSVNYPVLGISDRGHTQMMYPGEDYSFRGRSVTEYPMMGSGGEVNFTYAGENHRVYEKESPTGNGKGIKGHIMVNHPTENKGKWDTIDLTKITNGKVKTVAQGVASTKKWHKENPEYANGGMIKRADGSYSKKGLWDNIRDNAGSGKKPTKEMLKQERKIKSQYANGGKVSSWEIIEDLPKMQLAGKAENEKKALGQIQKKINEGYEAHTQYQKDVLAYAEKVKDSPDFKKLVGDYVTQKCGQEGGLACISTATKLLEGAGYPLGKGYHQNPTLQADVVSGKLPGYTYTNDMSSLEPGDLVQLTGESWYIPGNERAPHHMMPVISVNKNGDSTTQFKWFGSQGNTESIGYHESPTYSNSMPMDYEILKKQFVDPALITTRDSLKNEIKKIDPTFDQPSKFKPRYTDYNKDQSFTYNPANYNANNPLDVSHRYITRETYKPLINNKEELMKKYNIDNSEFNQLVKILEGIGEQETKNGLSPRYGIKQIPGTQTLAKLFKGDIKGALDPGQYSEGPWQTKGDYVPKTDYERGSIDEAFATLVDRYKTQVPNKYKKTDYGYGIAVNKYKGMDSEKNDYVKNVLNYSKDLQVDGEKNVGYDDYLISKEKENPVKNPFQLGNYKPELQTYAPAQDNTKANTPIINKSTVAPKMAVQKPGQSVALPPQFQKGGKTKKSNWQIIEY